MDSVFTSRNPLFFPFELSHLMSKMKKFTKVRRMVFFKSLRRLNIILIKLNLLFLSLIYLTWIYLLTSFLTKFL